MEYIVSARSDSVLGTLKEQVSQIFAEHGHGVIQRDLSDLSATIIQLDAGHEGALKKIRALPECQGVQINYKAQPV